MEKDASVLVENGGYLNLSKEWTKQLMTRMGFESKIFAEDFEKLKVNNI